MRLAHEAQVIPPIASSTCWPVPVVPLVVVMVVLLRDGCGRVAGSAGGGDGVAGLVDGGTDGGLVDRSVTAHGEAAGVEVDLDSGDAGDLGDLLGDGGDAVLAGHTGDGELGGGHGGSPSGGGSVTGQDRTRRAMASEASLTLASASGPPTATAWATQWLRCSSTRPSETDWRALVIAATWVRMSVL